MLVLKVTAKRLGLGLIICLSCALGIRKDAIGLVHLYSAEVRKRVAAPGMTTEATIQKREKLLKNGECARLSGLCAGLRMRHHRHKGSRVSSAGFSAFRKSPISLTVR